MPWEPVAFATPMESTDLSKGRMVGVVVLLGIQLGGSTLPSRADGNRERSDDFGTSVSPGGVMLLRGFERTEAGMHSAMDTSSTADGTLGKGI